jgi:hypothetical protein
MKRQLSFQILTLCVGLLTISVAAQPQLPPTLADFWEGRAEWVMQQYDVGLPIGESDTLPRSDAPGFRSYLHASNQSAGIIDQCGQPVEFPGCLTLWQSDDSGTDFSLAAPVCLLPCGDCPCTDARDHITAQQYPRIIRADDGTHYMAYEWHAQTILRKSPDGLTWSPEWWYLRNPGGEWPESFFPCDPLEQIGTHPNIRGQEGLCLVGGPPGLYIEGDTLYVFVMAGNNPAHMRCYKGNRHQPLDRLQLCETDPLFTGAESYGAVDAFGADAADYFDFRFISSADILRQGDYYYMAYEGIRGPSELEFGRDNQFGLGFARSQSLDSPWQTFNGNPVLDGLVDNWGIGHADLLVVDGETVMYTATSQQTRGRYVLQWRD